MKIRITLPDLRLDNRYTDQDTVSLNHKKSKVRRQPFSESEVFGCYSSTRVKLLMAPIETPSALRFISRHHARRRTQCLPSHGELLNAIPQHGEA